MAKSFIILPTIKSFKIQGYNMFNSDWNYKIQSGLNLIIGVNAIGKTTTVNILSYGIVGEHNGFHGRLDPDFFLTRLKKDVKQDDAQQEISDNTQGRVTIELVIGQHTILFTRSLAEDKIVQLKIDGRESIDNGELNTLYVTAILKFTGLHEIDDLTFLITRLLIREEEHNYLLWSEIDQSRVIRLLLNSKGFAQEFKKLEDALQEADTKYKREKDFMGRTTKRKQQFIDDRDRALANNKEQVNRKDLENAIANFKAERQTLTTERDHWLVAREKVKSDLKKNQDRFNLLKGSLDDNFEELRALEARHYRAVFTDPKSDYIFKKISERNICMVCNNNVTAKKVQEVIRRVNTQHECPVCSSGLTKEAEESGEPLSDKEIRRMETLAQSIKAGEAELTQLQKEADQLFMQSETISEQSQQIEKNLRDINLNIALNQHKLDQLLIAVDNEKFSNIDYTIKMLDDEIEEYGRKTVPLYKKYLKIKEDMRVMNDELTAEITKFNGELSKIFNSIAKKYFGETISLFIHELRPRGFEWPLSHYIPDFNGEKRYKSSSVSKSEAIFMEYLFRFALLRLYKEKTGIKPCMFLETSEGSFDVDHTETMAETMGDVGDIGFPFVIITNLSKLDFIEGLLPNVSDRKKRTFNLINYTNVKFSPQRQRKLNEALHQLKLA